MLALSLFPGLGVLDMAFAEAGWCVVRGPDVVWQGDVRGWHAPGGAFDGVFGGPPCQEFSRLAHMVRASGSEPRFGNLIPEFERIVSETRPRWFLMENVVEAPLPEVDGYDVWPHVVRDYEVGGVQQRKRRFSLGLREQWADISSPWVALRYEETSERRLTIISHPLSAGADYRAAAGSAEDERGERIREQRRQQPHPSIEDMLEAQGLPRGYLDESPFTIAGKRHLVGNAVSLAMGRAVAAVVRRALIA